MSWSERYKREKLACEGTLRLDLIKRENLRLYYCGLNSKDRNVT